MNRSSSSISSSATSGTGTPLSIETSSPAASPLRFIISVCPGGYSPSPRPAELGGLWGLVWSTTFGAGVKGVLW
jgi:hypothetical protein